MARSDPKHPSSGSRYLLGDSAREAARLRTQARLWDPDSFALFDRCRIRRGWRVLEIGPGQGSLHLELRRRTRRPVDAVEPSPAFAARLKKLCAGDGIGEPRIWETRLLDAPLPSAHYDLVFARWVFLFLPEPEKHLRRLARALKPGGLLALQDYHRESFALVPRPHHWAEFLSAERSCFAAEGADVSIGGRLPELYRRAGLEVVGVRPIVKFGSPGSPTWEWLSAYFLGVMERYSRFAPFTPTKASSLRRAWVAASRDETSVMIAPAVLDVVGRKRRTRAARRRQTRST